MLKRRSSVAVGAVGGLLWSGVALAQPPINLLAPTPLAPSSGTAIQAAPLPPPTILSPPAAGSAPPASGIATTLPAPGVPGYGAALPYLETAQTSIAGRRYVAAEEALEQAETRLLNDGIGTGAETGQAAAEALLQVRLARQAVAERDQAGALGTTGRALSAIPAAHSETQSLPVAPTRPTARLPPSQANAAAPPVPMITKALLPGHWQLSGWQYHWVPPETRLRPVETRAFVPGHYVWRYGAWAWDAGHYGDD